MKFLNSVFIVLLLISTYSGFSQNKENELLKELSSAHNAMGAVAGYTIDGDLRWIASTGYSDMDKSITFEKYTLTRIASIAKPMTAVAIMQLVESGQIDLDVAIQNYLPNFPKKKKGTITTRQLLSHTAGIGAYKNSKEAESTTEYESLESAMQVFVDRKLKFEPGTEFYYTTYGYVVLGHIIEKVSGMSYEEYMTTNIWEKASMNHTTVEHYDKTYENKADFYHYEKGKVKKGKKNNLSNRIPAGGFHSTLEDILKFGNAILDNTLITEGSLIEMTQIHSLEKEGNPYGLGWYMYAQAPVQHMVIGHSGAQTGCSAQLLINRNNRTVVAVLTNTSGKWEEVIGLAAQLMNIAGESVAAK